MIQAMHKKKETPIITKEQMGQNAPYDIIVNKISYKEERDKDGNLTIKRTKKKVNLTKKINETAKLIKKDIATEKIEEIEKIYTETVKKLEEVKKNG